MKGIMMMESSYVTPLPLIQSCHALRGDGKYNLMIETVLGMLSSPTSLTTTGYKSNLMGGPQHDGLLAVWIVGPRMLTILKETTTLPGSASRGVTMSSKSLHGLDGADAPHSITGASQTTTYSIEDSIHNTGTMVVYWDALRTQLRTVLGK